MNSFIAYPDHEPSVNTSGISRITERSAILHAKIDNLDNISSVTEYGFLYGATNDPQKPIKLTNPIGKDIFFAKIEEQLQENTTYYFRAFAKNNKGIAYGKVLSFKTDLSLPVVTILSSSRSTELNSFEITGKILSGINITSYGFCVKTSSGKETITRANNISEDGTFSYIIENLSTNTDYSITAYAENPKGKACGETKVLRIDEPSHFENFTCSLKDKKAKYGSLFSMKATADILANSEIVSAGFLVAEYKIVSSAKYNIGSKTDADENMIIQRIDDCYNGHNQVCKIKKNSISATISPLTGSSSTPMFFIRPYMLLANGNVVYGDVVICAK